MKVIETNAVSIVAAEHCLAFTNTVKWHASAAPMDTLHSFAELLGWAERAGVVGPNEVEQLFEAAQQQPNEAAALFRRAVAVREAIYRILVAYLREQTPGVEDVAQLNTELATTLAQARVVPNAEGYGWAWAQERRQLDAVLWPLVRAAGDLLTTPELLARVGQCADDRGCGWLFLDTSKNRSRRWCDINDCGNRAKQRRHYARTRKAE